MFITLFANDIDNAILKLYQFYIINNMPNVKLVKKGRKPTNQDAFDKVGALKKGESLVIKKKDWKIKTPPGKNILRRHIGREYEVATLADKSGWFVKALS